MGSGVKALVVLKRETAGRHCLGRSADMGMEYKFIYMISHSKRTECLEKRHLLIF